MKFEICTKYGSNICYDVTGINFRFDFLVTWSSPHGRDASSHKIWCRYLYPVRSYWHFSEFQDGGRRHLGFFKFRRHVSIDGWDINISILEKNKRPPYSNATSGFDFGYSIAIGMLFCIMLSNFIQIGPPTAEIWRHIHFSRWWPLPLNTTFGFVFVYVTVFRRAKSNSKPNFDISQFTAEI